MSSEAIVNLIVNADDAESSLNLQLRAIVGEAEARAPSITLDVDIDNRTVTNNITNIIHQVDGLGDSARNASRDGDSLSGTFGKVASSVGSAAGNVGGFLIKGGLIANLIPTVGGLVAALVNVAPAAAVATTAFVGMQAATLTLKLGLSGVSDAISAVFDPKADPKAVEEALKGLSKNARAFVVELQSMKPAFDDLRLDVQDRLFKGLDKTLASTGKVALPVLRKAALDFSGTFNAMARDTASNATKLGKSGTLGQALGQASSAFADLKTLPGDVLTSIVRLAASGGPLLNKLTGGLADLASSVTDKLGKSFESGGLEKAINQAGDLLAQLGRVAGNVFGIVSNVFGAFQDAGGGTFNALEQVTSALEKFSGQKDFQQTLRDLADVGSTLVATVLPLLQLALEGLFPVISVLSPVLQDIVTALGGELARIIPELSPVLVEAATAFGQVWIAIQPLLPALGDLVVAILPELIPLFVQLAKVAVDLTPLIYYFAQGFSLFIVPALVLTVEMLVKFNGLMFATIGVVTDVGAELVHFADAALYGVVIPAFQAVSALLQGDFSGAWRHIQTVIAGVRDDSSGSVRSMVSNWISTLIPGANQVVSGVSSAFGRLNGAVRGHLSDVNATLGGAPSRFISALGNLGSLLYNSGRALISGFISGIRSQLGAVRDAASSLLSAARDYFPFSPAKKGPFSGRGYTLYSGQKLVTDFAKGILGGRGQVTEALFYAMQGGRDSRTGPLLASSGGAGAGSALSSFSSRGGGVFARTDPTVNVYIGNEQFTGYVQTVVDGSFVDFNRQASQGVRA